MLAPESTLNERYRITYVVEDRPDGVIYRGIDNNGSMRVLIAELPQPNEAAVADVRSLATQIAGVSAPGILSLRDHFALGTTYYLVAEDPGGQDLERVARDRGGPMPEPEVLGYVDRLLGALDTLHSRTPPLTVGDLRSTDLWSSLDGGLFLAPFALVRHFASDASPFRAPELSDARAEPTTASDIYAIGAVLYQLLTGWAPPPAAQRQSGTPLNSPRVLNARVSALAEQLVLRSLELKAVNRYQQAREMRSAVETVRLMAGRPLGATAPVAAAPYASQQPPPAAPGATPPEPPRQAPAPGSDPGALYGPPPPAPPPGWTGTSPGAKPGPQPQWGPAPGSAATTGWQTVSPVAAPPPARRAGISNGCLVALVGLLALLAIGICVVGLWLGYLIIQSNGSLPLLPGASQAAATAAPATAAPSQSLPAPSAGADTPAAGESLTQAATFTQTQELQEASVGAVLYAPDGKTIAVGLGGDIQLRDAESLDPGSVLQGHSGNISALAFSPDGEFLASGAENENNVRVWEVGASSEARQLEGHSGWIRSLAFSPDGRLIASGSTDQTVIIWDAQNGSQIHTLEGHSDFLGAVAFSPDGDALASASRDGTVRLWDVRSGEQRDDFAFTAPENPAAEGGAPFWLTGVSFSPDGETIAVGSISGSVHLLDAATGRQEQELEGHAGWVVIRGLSFSPKGDLLASASLDGTVHLWSTGTGADRGTLQQLGLRLLGLAWSPDGQRLVTSSDTAGNIAVWNVSNQEVEQSAILAQGAVTALAYSEDGALLGTGGANGSVKVHILADGRSVPLSGGAPTNQYIGFLGENRLVAVSDGGSVVVITLTGSTDVRQLEGLDGFALTIAVSRDRRLLAAGNEQGDVTLWDGATLEEVRTLRGLGGPVYALAFNGDGSQLSAATNEPANRPKLLVWDVASGDQRATFNEHAAPVTAIGMPTGTNYVASASGDRSVRIWDATSGDEVRSLEAPVEEGWYSSIAFSPDGAVLVTGSRGGEVAFWNSETGERIGAINLGSGTILALAYRPDGGQVAVATLVGGVVLLEPEG